MEIREGRGVALALEIRVGGGVTVIQEIRVRGGGVKKPCHPSGGVDFFWNNPMSHAQINKCFVIGVV